MVASLRLDNDALAVPPVTGHPIDLDHLARMTMGDPSLEREILVLFVRQAGLMLARMEGPMPSPGASAAAHTLKGSALGIGAWAVARCAEAVERGEAAEFASAVRAAAAAVDEARAAITGLLLQATPNAGGTVFGCGESALAQGRPSR